MSNRFATSRSKRSASSQIVSTRSARGSAAISAPPSRSVVAAPVITASGVRKSWETAESKSFAALRSGPSTRRRAQPPQAAPLHGHGSLASISLEEARSSPAPMREPAIASTPRVSGPDTAAHR